MDITKTLRSMFSWKNANFAPTFLGVANIALAVFAAFSGQFGKAISGTTLVFGLSFLTIGLIRSKDNPNILASLFTALIGLSWFLSVTNVITSTLLMVLSFFMFFLVLLFQSAYKFGPENSKAKAFLLVPIMALGFTLILAFPGFSQFMKVTVFWTTRLAQNPWTADITLNYIITLFSYIATILFCWIYMFEYAGWEIFKKHTNLWMNLLALAAIALSILAWIQGIGIVKW